MTQDCLTRTLFTGNVNSFGGPVTTFSHYGLVRVQFSLESNPHNFVHVDVGGTKQGFEGLMSDPVTAALDPIFYLHHCNIDRMWAHWNDRNNPNASEPNWLNGPAAVGEREFVMPLVDGSSWVYTPSQVNSLALLDYLYDDPTVEKGVPDAPRQIVERFGLDFEKNLEIMQNEKQPELVGSNRAPVKLHGAISTKVEFKRAPWQETIERFGAKSLDSIADHVYLLLENVQGNLNANTLEVSVNDVHAGFVSLFGLRSASVEGGGHGGGGLTFSLEITQLIDQFNSKQALTDLESLDVTISPSTDIPDNKELTIGRVSVYRQNPL